MNTLDIFVQNYFSTTSTSSLTEFFYLLTILFDLSFSFISVSLCVAGLIHLVRNIKYAIFFLATLLSGAVVVYFMKLFFNVNRPNGAVLNAYGQSFPSYHATISVLFFILIMYIFDDYWKGYSRKIFNSACLLAVFLVSLSRLYLGIHWFSDVFFGLALGCVISYFAIIIFRCVTNGQV